MTENDRTYFRMRIEQELKAVQDACDPAVAGVHQALAARYSKLADGPVALQAVDPRESPIPE